jgi:hypothetical protein
MIDDEEGGLFASSSDTGHPGGFPIPLLDLNMENIMEAFRQPSFVSQWDQDTKTPICLIDRDCAKDVHHWNQAKR